MSEFGGGKTKIRRVLTATPPVDENFVPEYTAPTGVVTVTRLLRGPAGEDGLDGAGETLEDATFAYDVDGKLTTITKLSGVTTLTYDVEDKLETVVKPDHTKTLSYDVDDRLIGITIS